MESIGGIEHADGVAAFAAAWSSDARRQRERGQQGAGPTLPGPGPEADKRSREPLRRESGAREREQARIAAGDGRVSVPDGGRYADGSTRVGDSPAPDGAEGAARPAFLVPARIRPDRKFAASIYAAAQAAALPQSALAPWGTGISLAV
jgi:hypothetical protein